MNNFVDNIEEKQEKYLTWFEFHKMVKKKEKELRNDKYRG